MIIYEIIISEYNYKGGSTEIDLKTQLISATCRCHSPCTVSTCRPRRPPQLFRLSTATELHHYLRSIDSRPNALDPFRLNTDFCLVPRHACPHDGLHRVLLDQLPLSPQVQEPRLGEFGRCRNELKLDLFS